MRCGIQGSSMGGLLYMDSRGNEMNAAAYCVSINN